MSIKDSYDVVVVGGGPAGMIAAGRAAERGLSVLLLEKNDVLGKKLSITGGGRCNITNAEFDVHKLLKHYGDAAHFLYSPFSKFGVQETFDFFTQKNLPLIIEERNRAFPESMKATDVTAVMRKFVEDTGVQVLLNTPVQGFKTEQGTLTGIITDKGTVTAKSYIIASGGKSHPETGSTGEGISWLQEIGHTTHESDPNLVPLIVSDEWVRGLSGITLSDIKITFQQGNRKMVKQGNVLCTHFGLSGPLILNSAREVKKLLETGPVETHIDLFPSDDIGALRTKLQTLLETHSNKSFANALKVWFSKHIVDAILLPLPKTIEETKSHSLTREMRHAVVERMKYMTLTVTGTMGYDWAVVSDGGLDLKEIDTRTMSSKIQPNLYLVGDVLNVSRPSGGFSLQLCWTTGWVAGDSVCR